MLRNVLIIFAFGFLVIRSLPIYAGAVSSTKILPNSPFTWTLDIGNKTYKNAEINPLLQNGFTLLDNNFKCSLQYDSETTFYIKEAGPIYSERLWLECVVSGTTIGINAAMCSAYKDKNPEMNTQLLQIGGVFIKLICIEKKI